MALVKLFLFGSPYLEADGAPVAVDTRKAIALIAYLGLTGQHHTRDALATLLWPDYDQSRARAALRRTLSTLNKAMAGEWLDIERESVGLKADAGIWIDVKRFESRLAACRSHNHPGQAKCADCLAALTEAAQLYRDDFMAGFTLRDSPDFDEWQFFQSEGLRHELSDVLEQLILCHSLRGEWDTTITYARRWLALDPLHEPAHRQLMQLYAWAGQRAAALRQYRECVRVLDQELGVAPLEETNQIYQAIKENQALPAPVQPVPAEIETEEMEGVQNILATAPVPAAPAGLPLIGRAAEWLSLLEAYNSTCSDGRLIVLTGEAGIGKTRLAEEFLNHVRSRGGVAITARCYEGETNMAYGPISEGLRAALIQPDQASGQTGLERLANVPVPWLSEASRLLPELAGLRPDLPSPPPLDSPGAQSRFFESIQQLLLAVCAGPATGLILLDDLHWADSASLDLLTYLVRRLRGHSLCLLATWRHEETAAGPRLQQILAEAQRNGTATLLSLQRLNPSEVAELLAAARQNRPELVEPEFTGQAVEGLSARLYQETEGLPFFLTEYLAALAEGRPEDWSMPGGVKGLLQSRLAGVSETGRQLLHTAAVIGRSFDFDTLRAASGRGDEEVVVALEELIGLGLVEEVKNSGRQSGLDYDFSHEKLRTLVYDETSMARRRLLHRRVAEALIARSRSQRDIGAVAGQVAGHYQAAGQETEAAEYFRLAGLHARSLYANTEALTGFHTALALGHPAAAELHEDIGDLQTLLGEYSAAMTSYETAAALSAPDELARLEHKLGNVHHRRGEWDLAESYYQSALAALPETGHFKQGARLYADWSLTAHHQDQTGRALDLAHQARELAEQAGDTQALAQVHNLLGILARHQHETDLAGQHLEQSLALAETLGDPAARIAALNNLALACADTGQIDRALQFTEAALALCAAQGDRHREAALHNNLADLLHQAGRAEAAMDHLTQAVTIFAEIGAEAGAPNPEIWQLVEW